MRRWAGFAAAMAVTMATTAATCGPGTSSGPGQTLLDLINQKRAAAGCQAVTGNEQLRAAADRHVVDMRDNPAVRDDPNHIGSDGSTISQRIAAAGYTPAAQVGEIMYYALGPPENTPEAAVAWWMDSDGHRALIEDCSFTHAGVGVVYPNGTWFSVIDFGRH